MSNNLNIPKSVLKETKKIIFKAKEQGKIKPHVDAFKDYPVKHEMHEGKSNYYKNA